MSTEYDVIVSGAGPGGGVTATILAQRGYRVLLLDRQTFPRDKVCGDAVPAGAVGIMYRLGMQEKVETAVQRGEFYPLTQMRLVSPKNYRLIAQFHKGELNTDSYVAPRLHFDAVIQQHAVDSGAEFCQADVKQPIVEGGRVVGVQAQVNGALETIRAKMVVAADGVTSRIARALRPAAAQHVEKHRAVALRAYIEDLEEYPHEVEFYFYRNILPGYAWVFPIGKNRANIGLGMRLDHFRKHKSNLKQMLQEFLEMPALKQRLKRGGKLRDVATWQLNFGSQKGMQYAFDGALLVGDAAGFINPLTGGGIHNSMVSGELAAQTIDEALQRGDTSRNALRVYESRCQDALWDNMKRSYWIQVTLLRFPFLVDFLVHRMQENSTLAKTFLTKL
ncbi:MAG: NAD(P)/FAD-dependent oxidoreductase [Anaerolineales bacterium]|nr:NAD(P)/FAD-dependent oxidoreductase [Anaerolineales bacterium]